MLLLGVGGLGGVCCRCGGLHPPPRDPRHEHVSLGDAGLRLVVGVEWFRCGWLSFVVRFRCGWLSFVVTFRCGWLSFAGRRGRRGAPEMPRAIGP